MRKVLDIIRFILVSPEAIALLIILIIGLRWDSAVNKISQIATPHNLQEVVIILGISLAILFGCYRLGYDLLNPPKNKDNLLMWPEYWRLKNRIIYSFVICILGFLGAIVAVIALDENYARLGAITLITSLVCPAISVITIAYSRIMIREILG